MIFLPHLCGRKITNYLSHSRKKCSPRRIPRNTTSNGTLILENMYTENGFSFILSVENIIKLKRTATEINFA